MLKIGLIGVGGKNNFGDDLMQSLLKKELSNFGDVTEYSDQGTADIYKSDETMDHLDNDLLVFGGGNIISKDFWAFKSLEGLKGKQIMFLNVNLTKSVYDEQEIKSNLLNNLRELNAAWVVRDLESQLILSEYKIESTVIPDIVSTVQLPNKPKKRQLLIFLNQHYFEPMWKNDLMKFHQTLFCSYAIAKHADWMNFYDWQVVFVPCQVTPIADDRIPAAFTYNVCIGHSKKKWIDVMLSTEEILDLIAESELVITMRLHPAIVAISNNIPTILISFHDKFDNIMKDYGLENIVLSAHLITHEQLILTTNIALSIDLKDKISTYLNKNLINYQDFIKGNLSN